MDERPLELVDVILPPPAVRRKIDVTANYVATKGGLELEAKIREGKARDPSFSFLNPGDPYYAYYQKTVMDIKLGKVVISDESLGGVETTEVKKPKKSAAAQPKEPAPFEFALDTPQIAAQDLDIIKLTALFGARNGRQFLAQLVQREARNYQFDFLRPNHNLFPYFSQLLQQYTKILVPSADLYSSLHQRIEDKHKTLERCVQRADWLRHVEANRKEQEEREKSERDAYLAVDWNDFVVVQTIEMHDSEQNLPPPTSVHQLQAMPLVQRKQLMIQSNANSGTVAAGSGDTGGEMETGD